MRPRTVEKVIIKECGIVEKVIIKEYGVFQNGKLIKKVFERSDLDYGYNVMAEALSSYTDLDDGNCYSVCLLSVTM